MRLIRKFVLLVTVAALSLAAFVPLAVAGGRDRAQHRADCGRGRAVQDAGRAGHASNGVIHVIDKVLIPR
jgi:hypothetical protein